MPVKLFAPGPDARRTGRTRGAKDRFAAAFLKDFLEHWEQHGKDAIRILFYEHPDRYVAIAASIVPKELLIEEGGPLTELSEEDLTAFVEHVRQERAKIVDVPLIEDKVTNGRAN